MRRLIFASFVLMTAFLVWRGAAAEGQNDKPGDPWGRFQFLLGSWSGSGSGKPGEATGSCSFSFELGNNVVVRRNRTEFPPGPGEKTGVSHEDLMIIYRQPADSTFRAIYFDNEGHVINYTVSFAAKTQSVVFESEGSGKTPRFRLVHELEPDGLLATEFAIAAPGGEFRTYTKGTAKRSQ